MVSIFIQVLHFKRIVFKSYYNDFFSCSESDGQLKNTFCKEKTIKSSISMNYDTRLLVNNSILSPVLFQF